MFEYTYKNIRFISNEELAEAELEIYLQHCKEQMRLWQERNNTSGQVIYEITLNFDGEFVDPSVRYRAPKFQRIRRITGYLVGAMDRWNDAKSTEERDRVKHGVC